MSSEVEETLKRLVGHKGVIGTIVVNSDGIVSHIFIRVSSVFEQFLTHPPPSPIVTVFIIKAIVLLSQNPWPFSP